MKKNFYGWPAIFIFFCSFLFSGPESRAAEDIAKGRAIFNTKCVPCHSIGGGEKVGPDLKGITDTRSKEWLRAFISNPDKMFGSDPQAAALLKSYKIKMPNLGMSETDVDAVLAYIRSQSGAAKPKQEGAGAATGNPAAGKEYFIGSRELRNRGAPCIGCHAVAAVNFMGGGNLGPDLTQVYSKYGEGLAPVLTNIPFPVMVPVFANHPILPDEAANLSAFFMTTAASQPRTSTHRIIAASLIGFVILMAIIWFVWRHRLVSVRADLVRSSRKER